MSIVFTLSPIRSDEPLELVLEDEVLSFNGEPFDLSGIAAPGILAESSVPTEVKTWVVGGVTRTGDGTFYMTIRLPHGSNAPDETRNPAQQTVSADGPVSLPIYDSGAVTPIEPQELTALTHLASVSTLRSQRTPANGQHFTVREYSTGSGRGGGLLRWDAASTAEADGGLVISRKSGGGGRFHRLVNESVVPLESFGIDLSGGTNDTEKITTGINKIAAAGYAITAGPGIYRADSPLALIGNGITIDAHPEAEFRFNDPNMGFRLLGSHGSEVSLTGDVGRGDQVLPIAGGGSEFRPGDVLKLYGDFVVGGDQPRAGEMVVVESSTDTTITLRDPIYWLEYLVADSARFRKITFAEKLRINGGRWVGPYLGEGQETFANLWYVRDAEFHDMTIENFQMRGFYASSCWEPRFVGLKFNNIDDDAQGKPLLMAEATRDALIKDCTFRRCGTSFDCGGKISDFYQTGNPGYVGAIVADQYGCVLRTVVEGCKAYDMIRRCYATHEAGWDTIIRDCYGEGDFSRSSIGAGNGVYLRGWNETVRNVKIKCKNLDDDDDDNAVFMHENRSYVDNEVNFEDVESELTAGPGNCIAFVQNPGSDGNMKLARARIRKTKSASDRGVLVKTGNATSAPIGRVVIEGGEITTPGPAIKFDMGFQSIASWRIDGVSVAAEMVLEIGIHDSGTGTVSNGILTGCTGVTTSHAVRANNTARWGAGNAIVGNSVDAGAAATSNVPGTVATSANNWT